MKLVNGLHAPESAAFWPDSAILRRGMTLLYGGHQRHGRFDPDEATEHRSSVLRKAPGCRKIFQRHAPK
jgi:hypothetical protein